MKHPITRAVLLAAVLLLTRSAAPAGDAGQQPDQTTQAQQRPVFRGGTHFVRVDAYPVRDGKIVEGLTLEDFEILEDGRPQIADSLDFIRFDTFSPVDERLDPHTQREAFELAADPRNRVFVIFVDMVASGRIEIHHIQDPLVAFLNRVLGPRDLFGFLTSRNHAQDLVFSGVSTTAEAQARDLFRSANIDKDEADELFTGCPLSDATVEAMKALYRRDMSYTTLAGVVQTLGALRQERKSIVLVSNALSRARPATALVEAIAGKPPRIGVTNGKLGIGNDQGPTAQNSNMCTSELRRLANIDFDERYRRLVRDARDRNVAVYPVSTAGVEGAVSRGSDDLRSLADETDGLAVVGSNDLGAGMRRIAEDLAAYYVLGYYTTNTRWDGGVRKITVRDRRTGKAIRARRQYLAPTEQEIAALSVPRPAAVTSAADTGPPRVTLLGEPSLYLNGQAASSLVCSRTDRVRIEFPVTAPMDARIARLLDARGQAMPIPVNVRDNEAVTPRRLIVTLSLAPLTRGSYSIELDAAAGSAHDRRVVPLWIQ
jgi:VWFA-related protein